MEVSDSKLNIALVGSPEDLALTAFEVFMDDAAKAIESNGKFHVAVSGGHTPERLFELLGILPSAKIFAWDKVQMFWVDERCVPPEAEASNYGMAAHTFLDKVSIPPSNVHRVIGECNDYNRAVINYEQTICEVFKLAPGQKPAFDLIVLGMGADGHIASLYPNSYALFDTEDLVSAVYFMGNKCNRITLTHPVLCAAKHLMILVSGPEKAAILKEVLYHEPDEIKYPVHTLWAFLDKVTWVVDRQAGKYL